LKVNVETHFFKDSFTLERSEAERSKDCNHTATAVTAKLQRNNAAQSVDMLH